MGFTSRSGGNSLGSRFRLRPVPRTDLNRCRNAAKPPGTDSARRRRRQRSADSFPPILKSGLLGLLGIGDRTKSGTPSTGHFRSRLCQVSGCGAPHLKTTAGRISRSRGNRFSATPGNYRQRDLFQGSIGSRPSAAPRHSPAAAQIHSR